ncbi:PREDICTED: kinase suppressor of Ras 1 isoform X10 [Hipposideros armiger]|uniref:non-specific serine/threonine protein kinase n=1 Tax=Hipposideros armiger TaxID=186990 RepID=A0A8B7RTT9_HIPAR|nr:PREDICTED: kinase suppressor of Ras 1 isoform X10 [Hipposideros armiger]
MDRAARRAAAMGEKKEGGGGGAAAAAEGGAGAAANRALQQCGQLQKLIDISIGSLRGLRTKCAVSNDLTQQEIRTLEAKLVRYICKQRQCKLSVAPGERPSELNSYPRFSDWLYTFNVRPEVVQEILRELTLDALLDMNEAKVKETLRRCGASVEECGRLQYALTCLRKVTGLDLPHGSPQMVRRDIGLSVTHRFSTKSWLSQVCHVCQKNMMFGVKCKHCRLKCHNKCTKEAPACRISFLPISRLRRTESVPSDINNPVDRAAEPHFGTLPKALTKKEHPPAMNHLDSSSNPSSTTSSTPSSPAPFPTSSNPSSATTPPNPSPGQRDSRFNFPAAYFIHHRQQFIFPDISAFPQAAPLPDAADSTRLDDQPKADVLEDHEAEAEEPEADKSEAEDDEDEVDDLPSSRRPWRGPISRKASQTSVYLQEWDIPFEQVELGEPIGQGRWGRVHRGRWHGEVAIRLLEMDGHNQDHLKLFKKEVMNYRQTRHENVVLFMGACMNPPHLAIITSFCKGRTLHSFVRDPKTSLDINKTRQIAQEIIKGMGYLHAKGIVHKDLKSKNVFYDNGKVVITDFGLFGISGVVREGRRENQLKLSHDWLCYLAPEVVREMTPGKDEDHLPFSKAADVYAFGTVWYELQARDWPLKNQAAEALIWQIGSGEGMKRVLASISLGKEVTEILSACWAFDLQERPSFTLLMEMLEKLPKLNRRLSHPGHFWKSADRWRSRYYGKGRYGHADFKNSCPVLEEYINSSKVVPRFERFGLGVLESSNPKM